MAGNLARLVNIGHTQLHTVPKWLISGETALTARLHTQKSHFCQCLCLNGKKSRELDDQFVELLTEQDPAKRSGQHDTLEAAIAAHKRDFGKA
jgi:hypothetical protein